MARPVKLPFHRTAIMGQTGSGKTFWALDWFDRLTEMAVYVDYANVVRRKDWAAKYRPLAVDSVAHIKATLWKNRKAVLVPGDSQEVEDLVAGILAWKKNAAKPAPMWIFLDEIHIYSDQWQYPAISALFTTGRNFNVAGVALTQNLPAMRNTTIITQCRTKVVFSIDDAAIHALRRNYSINLPPEVREHIDIDANKYETERRIWNGAVYGLTGSRWILI